MMALRICRFFCLSLWVVTLTSWPLAAQTSDGQPNGGGQFAIPETIGVGTSPISETRAPVIVRSPCDPDYWIVSTRHARDEIQKGQACQYEVLRYEGAKSVRNSSIEELVSSLQPSVPVCFMAHGSFVTWDSMLNDSARTYQWLREAAPGQPLHMIFYTWASNDGDFLPHIKVNKLGNRSSLNGFYLADVISKISCDHPISMIGHSHGTRLVSSALHAMAGGTVDGRVLAYGPQPGRRIRVVLAAAAIDHNWLNPDQRYGLALCPAEGVINLQNHTDFPLLFYPFRRPFSRRAMAITGVTRAIVKKCANLARRSSTTISASWWEWDTSGRTTTASQRSHPSSGTTSTSTNARFHRKRLQHRPCHEGAFTSDVPPFGRLRTNRLQFAVSTIVFKNAFGGNSEFSPRSLEETVHDLFSRGSSASNIARMNVG